MARNLLFGGLLLSLLSVGCSPSHQPAEEANQLDKSAVVMENMLSRRSIRKYKPQAVNRDTMHTILNCGIQAPNGMNKQSWAIRVVDNPEIIDGLTELYVQQNPKAKSKPGFVNIFNGSHTVAFIAHDTTYDLSQVDCGLLGENMMLSAWSMGIGSCCLGGPVRFMNSEPAAEYLKRLDFPEGYELLYAIAFGYPDEAPAAKPRSTEKFRYVD